MSAEATVKFPGMTADEIYNSAKMAAADLAKVDDKQVAEFFGGFSKDQKIQSLRTLAEYLNECSAAMSAR